MAKTKISKKQKKSIETVFPRFKADKKLLLDKKLISEILVDALLENDFDTFRDVLMAYLRNTSKTQLAKKTGLGRRTLYDLIENEKFDPRVSTLSALLSKIVA